MWCKLGQYLDYKNCICKNKLIGRVIAKSTSVINETMMNNRDNIANDNTITNIWVYTILNTMKMYFILVINDIKDYFETNGDGINYLTIIFDNEKYEKIFKSIWNKVKENKFDKYAKNYNVISFKSDDILKYGCPININTITIIVRSVFKVDCYYYPQNYLDNCSYNYKDEIKKIKYRQHIMGKAYRNYIT